MTKSILFRAAFALAMTFALALALSFPGRAQAGYEQGAKAYNNGDYAAAFAEFLALAEAGNAASQYNLGLMYAKGQYVAQDFVLARKWFAQAADQGHAMAQGSLGVMYAKGQGVDKNLAQAKYWLDAALANPHASEQYRQTAAAALEEVMAEISPEELQRAKALAAERAGAKKDNPYKMHSSFLPNQPEAAASKSGTAPSSAGAASQTRQGGATSPGPQ